MPARPPHPLLHPSSYCTVIGTILTSLGAWVPPDEQHTDAERVHHLLTLLHAWVLEQLHVVAPEVGLGAVTAARTQTLTYLRDRHPEPVSLLRITASLVAQTEVLLGPDPREGTEEVVRQLLIATTRTLLVCLTPVADAELPEITEFDVNGDHEYEPARRRWLTDALAQVQSAAARLIAARSS